MNPRIQQLHQTLTHDFLKIKDIIAHKYDKREIRDYLNYCANNALQHSDNELLFRYWNFEYQKVKVILCIVSSPEHILP